MAIAGINAQNNSIPKSIPSSNPGKAQSSGGGIGGFIGRTLGFDITPGFNVNSTAGGGIPFVSKGNGSTGQPGSPPTSTVTGYYPGGGNSNADAAYAQYAADPYAAFGGQANYNNLLSSFTNQKNNIFGTAGEAADTAGLGYKNSILDFIDTLRSGQGKLDNQAIQAELAKKQGGQSILDMVGRGIRSGGVQLANKNAGDSSATGALAQAYGDIGRRQMSSVGNQYAQEMNAVDQGQTDLNQQEASGVRKLGDSKTQAVNSIVIDARNQLAALDSAIASASLPDRIDIEGEKERVRAEALGKLQQYDQLLAQGTGEINPLGQDQRRLKANELANAGTAASDQFTFDTEAPAEFQNTGPFASELPIFTYRNKKVAA